VQLAQASTYTGGTVIDGSAGPGAVTLRVIAAGALGSGAVTLNGGVLQINSESNLTFTNPINVIGTAASGISFDHLTSASSKTETVGPLSLGGQTIFLTGPATSGYTYTLAIGGTTISPAGATIINSGGSSSGVKTGALTLNGNLNLATTSTNFAIDALSGTGSITRNSSTGTVIFGKSANGYSGNYFTSVGTTNFTASNTLGIGTYQFANGTYNINIGGAGALSGATGSMQLGSLNLNTANALDGTSLNFTGGNLFTAFAGSLGTGTIQLNGGKMFLRSDAGAVFGGTINVRGISGTNNTGSLTVDRASTAGAGGVQTISALNLVDQSLNLIAGNAGYGLSVSGATTVGGNVGGTITNNAAVLNLSSLTLNAPLTITGTGNANIGALSGAASLSLSSPGNLTFTAASQSGFTSSVIVGAGAVNVNNAASFSGGIVTVNGGILNLGVANALTNTQAVLVSGFLNANAANALSGVTLPISNGTLFAAANNALGNATINMTGGNLTATVPGALGSSNISLSNAILALRSDSAAGFGGSVTLTGTGFSTVSVAKLTDAGGTGNSLSINNLTLGGQTLNVTGADNDVFTVINPVTMTGTSPTTINTTAADALFQGALTGAGALVKNGVRSLRLDNGGTFGATTVNAGTLTVNNTWNGTSVTVGGTSGAATLQLGGAGSNALGNLTINAGTLRIAKANIPGAIPVTSALTVGTNGDVKVEYAGQSASTLANNITVDTSLAARTLTLSATSGSLATQGSTFTIGGQIVKSGANALNVIVQADTALDDGFNSLIRPPSRLVLGANQTFTTDLQHNGGIVIGKGNVPAGAAASPFGLSANPLNLNVTDSTIGGMVADGASSALFSKVINTAASSSPRKRLGAFFNPAGLVGTQTINFNGSFTWNDGSTPLYVMIPAGNVGGAAAVSPWNGMIVDPGAMLQINSGAVLDNILTSTTTAVTSVAPVYVGGGGTVRFTTGITRTLSQAKGLAGTVTVLDNTLFQSNTTGQHFDGVELRSGTYQVGATTAQALAGGFAVNASPFDLSRTTSNLITDVDLALNGVGAAAAFRIGAGQTLAKSGAGALNVNGDQLHGINSTLQVNQGVLNLNTDAGMNNGAAPVNNLSLAVNNGATVNFAVTQHLSQLSVNGGGMAKLSSIGTKAIEATSVSATTGKVDLTTNRLIVDYGAGFGSPMSSIRQQILSGYNAAGTLWGGNGIMSSTAAAAPSSVGLGYAEASDVLGPTGGLFGGENVDESAVLVRYTKFGDANLDGVVDFTDLARLAQSYNTTVAGSTESWWARGDFTYDGIVDFNDLAKLAQNYNTALPSQAVPSGSADFSSDLAAAFAQAPEPGTIGILSILGAVTLLRRGRRGRIRDGARDA
jgi:fibronectin-binding autotransporter adhesin